MLPCINTTVKENESLCTKAEVERAHTTYELVHANGYPSLEKPTLKEKINNQHVYTDVMHVPPYLVLQCKIENEGSTKVRMALQAQLAILRSR
jgi:hypothetical protein